MKTYYVVVCYIGQFDLRAGDLRDAEAKAQQCQQDSEAGT